MNKVSNLIKFYNREPINIINDLTIGYSNYPFSLFRDLLKTHGHKIITSIIIVRTPISNILYQILNNLTLGQLEERLKDYNYNQLFHLKIIINNKYSIEKESTIKFSLNNNIQSNSETIEVKNIPYNLTIGKLLENCLNKIGKEKMFSYNAKQNNCQVFIRNLLEASGMYDNQNFIMQDIKQIFHEFTGTGLIPSKSKQEHKLTTLTNSDIYSICIKLKLKLNGIYMKDELKAPLAQGNYIINLQNHDENGSHWTCFIKDKNNIYYYDSFGVVMPQNQYDIFRNESENIYYNTSDDQCIDSTSCGWWCIAFLYFMNTTKGPMLNRMKKFDKKFNKKNTIENEIDLKNYIDKIYFK